MALRAIKIITIFIIIIITDTYESSSIIFKGSLYAGRINNRFYPYSRYMSFKRQKTAYPVNARKGKMISNASLDGSLG